MTELSAPDMRVPPPAWQPWRCLSLGFILSSLEPAISYFGFSFLCVECVPMYCSPLYWVVRMRWESAKWSHWQNQPPDHVFETLPLSMMLLLWFSWLQSKLDWGPHFICKCFCCCFEPVDIEDAKTDKWGIFMALALGYNHQQMSEGQRQKSEFYNRTASESNVYLNSFHYPDHSYKDQAFDTLSLDSSDSMETSISACSPDNISR